MCKVSFIVISYNIKNYIEKCIRSILEQTLNDIEVIIVDDGSKDGTLEILNTLSKEDSRIKLISQKNMGANAARKTGLKYANGEYINFIDGDDWVSNELAEKMYRLARKKNSDIICYDYYVAYDNKNNKEFINDKYEDINGDKYLKLLLTRKIFQNVWNRFIKREFIEKTEFLNTPDSGMGEDLADNIVWGLGKPSVSMSDEKLYFYYKRNDSAMNKSSARNLEIKDSLEYIEKIFKEKGLYEKYSQEIEFLWFEHCYSYRIFYTEVEIDIYHKKLYEMWKNKSKKINIKDNKYYKEYISTLPLNMKIIKKLFDINYNLGCILLKQKKFLEKLKYKI